jgi:hypothetical protein
MGVAKRQMRGHAWAHAAIDGRVIAYDFVIYRDGRAYGLTVGRAEHLSSVREYNSRCDDPDFHLFDNIYVVNDISGLDELRRHLTEVNPEVLELFLD